jgi:hypothetical protein
VCLRKCSFKYPEEVKPLPHVWHMWGFSPVCDLICLVNTLE